jgi:hypothetical protein
MTSIRRSSDPGGCQINEASDCLNQIHHFTSTFVSNWITNPAHQPRRKDVCHIIYVACTSYGPRACCPRFVYFAETPTFGNPQNEEYGSFRRDVELWLELTDMPITKQGIALVGCLLGEPKEFAKTLPTEQLTAENSGMNILSHLDKAFMKSDEMILNTRVSNFLECVV